MSTSSNTAAAAAAAATIPAGGDGAAAAVTTSFERMTEALTRGLGVLDAAAAGNLCPIPAAAVDTATDNVLLGDGGDAEDDGGVIDDAILEDDSLEIHAVGNVEEAMDELAAPPVPVASSTVAAASPAVRPKESVSGRAQWHAQAGPRADRGASEGERRKY